MGLTQTYVPQAGTIPARVLAHLATLPPGAMVASGVLADELGIDPNLSPFLRCAHERGALAKEVRDGRAYWGLPTGRPLRPLSAPSAVTADDDEVDDAPIVQRVVPAAAAGGVSLVDRLAWTPPSKEPEMTTNVSDTPPQKQRKPRALAPAFDPLAIAVRSDRALPPATSPRAGEKSRYLQLLERLKPGDSVDLHPRAAKSLVTTAKKAGIKLASRALSKEVTGVWRL